MTTKYILGCYDSEIYFGLRRRNNELHELTNFVAALRNNDELRRERPERAASPQPRATPWVPGYKALRPVRAKVWAHLLFITFALTGRRCGTYVNPGRCPGLRTCWAFSPRRAARMSRNREEIRLIRPAASERPGNSLIRLIRCYAVRGQHRIAAQPRTPVAKIRLIRSCRRPHL